MAGEDKLGCINVTWKDYVDGRFKEINESRAIASASMEKRLDSMNEFRDTLRDQATSFMPRAEVEATLNRVETDVQGLRESRAVLEGKASQNSVNIALLIAVMGAVMSCGGLTIALVTLFSKLFLP